jgi:hypothetical protein
MLAASTVPAGGTVAGTVTLSQAAPAGGAVLALSSNSPSATVPATVTVAAGATSATFTIYAPEVAVPATVTITATYQGSSATATLTVQEDVDGARISLDTEVHDKMRACSVTLATS